MQDVQKWKVSIPDHMNHTNPSYVDTSISAKKFKEQEEARLKADRKQAEERRKEEEREAKARITRRPATTEFPALPAPASSLSGSKESRLSELLQKYKADQITPEEYHRERAKILAEP